MKQQTQIFKLNSLIYLHNIHTLLMQIIQWLISHRDGVSRLENEGKQDEGEDSLENVGIPRFTDGNRRDTSMYLEVIRIGS